MEDIGFVRMTEYMMELSLVFTQSSPFFDTFLKEGHVLFEHPLFKHPSFPRFRMVSKTLVTTLKRLKVDAPHALSKVPGLRFETHYDNGKLVVTPSSTMEDEDLKLRINRLFNDVCKSLTELEISDQHRLMQDVQSTFVQEVIQKPSFEHMLFLLVVFEKCSV